MNNPSLPELGAAGLLFLVTLLIAYVIWRVLLGKRLPAKEKKPTAEKKPTLSLNEIMGYDFIQVKDFGQTETGHASAAPTASAEQEAPALYTTGNEEPEDMGDEGDGNEGYEEGPTESGLDTFNVTEDVLNELFAWCEEESTEAPQSAEHLNSLAAAHNNYSNFISNQGNDDSVDRYDPSAQDLEHEAEMDRYRDEVYNRYMDSCTADESDRAALLGLSDLTRSMDDPDHGSDYDDEDAGAVAEDDLPTI